MAKIYGYYEYDDSLTPGNSDDGGLSQLLFSSEGKLADHASFHPGERDDEAHDTSSSTDDSDPDADAQAAALLILAVLGAAVGGYVIIRKAAPHVQRMINERALPAVRSFWSKVRGQDAEQARDEPAHTALVVVDAPAEQQSEANEPGTDLAAAKPRMSAEEWYGRFRAMFEARQFAAEQWKLLSLVQVEQDEAIGELQREMKLHNPEEVVQRVTRMLESAPTEEMRGHAMPHSVGLPREHGG